MIEVTATGKCGSLPAHCKKCPYCVRREAEGCLPYMDCGAAECVSKPGSPADQRKAGSKRKGGDKAKKSGVMR